MKRRIQISIIIVFLPLFHYSTAQNNELQFNLVEGSNGKLLGNIGAITQDPRGYMWFAGQSAQCLYRYDGNRMISFRQDDANPNSLGGTTLETVYADDSGMIWVGFGDKGLDQFNPATGIFKHYRNVPNDSSSLSIGIVTVILKDHQGILWVGTHEGLDRLDEKTGKFFHYRNEPGNPRSLSSNNVRAMYEDHRGVLWIGTGVYFENNNDGGLNRFDRNTGTFTRYLNDPKNPHSLINNKVRAIFEDSRGTFWVGTSGDGLHTMDRSTGSFERHLYNPAKPDELSRPKLKPGGGDHIAFINEDNTGAIWIGTDGAGINRYNPVTKKITHYQASNGFPDSSCWNDCISHDGVLWIATQASGLLYRVDPFHKSIDSIPTFSQALTFMEDKEGYLWVGTVGSGILKFDQNKNLIQQFKHDPSDPFSLFDNFVGCITQTREDTILVGTGGGVRIFNKVTQQFSRLHDDGNLKDAATNLSWSRIYQDKQGLIWFGRWGVGLGLVRYNPKDNSFKHFTDTKDSSSIGTDLVGRILEDRSGSFWVGGYGHISRLNRETGRFKHYIRGRWILDLYEDSSGTLWAGTDRGLFQYNQKEDRFTSFFDPQSEINSFNIGGIIEDNAKNLWLTSPSAIIRLNTSTKETFVYGIRFGINPNSLLPWADAYKNRKGQLFIGNPNGFYIFSPEELSVKTDLKIIITDFFINTLPILPGKGSPLQKPVDEISDLDLKYNQNNIAFNFAAIDYRAPETIKYFYMLEGYDREWQEVKEKKENSSYYFNLPRGKYVYRVKAFNSDATKGEKVITIRINPPWWQTWRAFTSYILLSVFSIWGFIRWRTRTLQKEKTILEEKVIERTMELKKEKETVESTLTELKSTQAQLIQSEKMASLGELTAGIAHEIQNPLNFVNNFSELSNELIDEMKEELTNGNNEEAIVIADDIKQNLEKINHHGKRASDIVTGMLQHSRTSTGIKEQTDINALADEYLRLSYHGLRAKDNTFNATMKTDFDSSIGKINIITQDIGRVILNLINNAFYAVTEKRKLNMESYEPIVSVRTKKNGNTVEIIIKDNGNGIPQKILDKIFQPFFTTKPTGQGTGLGLSLSYDIIKAHNGSITVNTYYREPGSTNTISNFREPGEISSGPFEKVETLSASAAAQAGTTFIIQLPINNV
ncbi:MAG: two-component regulator propeller domain-containing protein [Saprospiraceae bacterium]